VEFAETSGIVNVSVPLYFVVYDVHDAVQAHPSCRAPAPVIPLRSGQDDFEDDCRWGRGILLLLGFGGVHEQQLGRGLPSGEDVNSNMDTNFNEND
jgi:hypothetical protein